MVVFDENVSRKLRRHLRGFTIRTVAEIGLSGYRNGRLLAALPPDTSAFLTHDRALRFQQNVPKLSFGVILVTAHNTSAGELLPFVPKIRDALTGARPGTLTTVEASSG